jgi:hypothetical protein
MEFHQHQQQQLTLMLLGLLSLLSKCEEERGQKNTMRKLPFLVSVAI